MATRTRIESRLLIHGVTCTCRPGCPPDGVCRWVGCCRSPIESARLLPPDTACADPMPAPMPAPMPSPETSNDLGVNLP